MKRENIFVILALMIVLGVFLRPQITGMVVGEVNHTLLEINKVFNESTELDLSLEGNLTYLAVSGSYSGENVEIYLGDLLVYASQTTGNKITGNIIGASDNGSMLNITDMNLQNTSNTSQSQDISVNQTNVSEISNISDNISYSEPVKAISFNNECKDTCILDNYPANATMRIVLDNATLNLTSITYTYLQTADTKIIQNETYNNSKNISYTEFDHSNVKIGEPVTWSKTVEGVDIVTLPGSAYNIKTDEDVKVNLGDRKLSVEEFSELKAGKPKQILLELENISKQTTITYETPGPEKTEKHIDQYKKQVTISSDIHYRNVLAHTDIDEAERDLIQVHWLTDSGRQKVHDIVYLDENDNGLIDKIEWVVPHLSSQTYEISITVLNPYEYLRDGETWIVAFNTTGVGNLTISSPNAGWTEFLNDDPETFDEMEFLDIKCGEQSLKDELKLIDFNGDVFDYNDLEHANSLEIEKLFVEDYTCDDIGYLSNYMHKAGYATLMFEFANQKGTVRDYAYDPENYTYTFSGVSQSTNDHFAYEVSGTNDFSSPGEGEVSFNCGDNITYGSYDYRTVEIGKQCWLAESLKVTNGNTDLNCSLTRYCPDGNSSQCEDYGGLYYWNDMMCGEEPSSAEPSGVQGICPQGWHIPSHYEVITLERQICSDIGNSNCNSTFKKDLTTTDTIGQDTTTGEGEGSALAGGCSTYLDGDLNNQGNCNNDFGTSGMNLFGLGYRNSGGSYSFHGEMGRIMTTTTEEAGTGNAWFHCTYYWRTDIEIWTYGRDTAYQVRCVRDEPEEANNTEYNNLASSDDNYWITDNATTEQYDSQLYKFYIDEPVINISQLDFTWEGYGEETPGYNTSLSAFDYENKHWVELTTYDFTTLDDQNLTYSMTSDIERFIDNDGEMTIMAKTLNYICPKCRGTTICRGNNETVSGDMVYCDSVGRLWSTTANVSGSITNYQWYNGSEDNPDDICVGDGSNYPACDYCDTLDYAGFTDWYLPTCQDDDNLPDSCQLYQFGVEACNWTGGDGSQDMCYPSWDPNSNTMSYWSSSEWTSNSGYGWRVSFGSGSVSIHQKKYEEFLRCVRNANASPYLYVYNGHKYDKLSDFTPGATSPSKEYLDFKDVSHVNIEEGKIKLKITEELDETAYVDRIYILVDESKIINLSYINANKTLLEKSDDKYLVMNKGDEYYLEFESPGKYKSLKYAAEGYYIVHKKGSETKKHSSLNTDYVELKVFIDEPPYIQDMSLSPESIYNTDNIDCNATPLDSVNDTLDVEYFWYNCTERPCSLFSGGNKTGLTNGTNYVIDTLSSTNIYVGEVWNCSIRSFDGKQHSTYQSRQERVLGKINGTLKQSDSSAVDGGKVIVVDQDNSTYTINTTSDASGYWEVDVNNPGEYIITGHIPDNSTPGLAAEGFVEVTP